MLNSFWRLLCVALKTWSDFAFCFRIYVKVTWAIAFALGSGGDFVIASGPGWDSDLSALSVILVGTRPASLTCLHFQWICSSLFSLYYLGELLTPLPTPQWLRSRLGSGFPSCQSGLIICKYKPPLSTCNHSFCVLWFCTLEIWKCGTFGHLMRMAISRARGTERHDFLTFVPFVESEWLPHTFGQNFSSCQGS